MEITTNRESIKRTDETQSLWYNRESEITKFQNEYSSSSIMKIYPEIFRMYDIRGKYPEELNEDIARKVGRGFVHFLRQHTKKNILTIVVGRDTRISSPRLFRAFSRGVREEGCNVVDVGLICTPMLYFTVSHFRYDGGAMISASHNPNPYNGIKLTREKAIPLGGPSGIFWIREYIRSHAFTKSSQIPSSFGRLWKKDITKEYLEFHFQIARVNKGELKGISVALDAGNGVGGPIAMEILKRAGVTVYPLYVTPDGRFPHHIPDPLIRENLRDLISLVRAKKPTLGVALDGDADRIIFVDENGKPISGDLITALMAQILSKEVQKKSKFLYDIRSSNAVPEIIKEAGGISIPFQIGHALIKEKMRREKILFGGELSGHYYWGRGLFYEVPFVVLLKILREIKEQGIPLSAFIQPIERYSHSGEINFEAEDTMGRLKMLETRYRRGRISKLDGLRVDFRNWWFLARPSNTEPVLRLVIEAKTKKLLEQKKRELTKILKG